MAAKVRWKVTKTVAGYEPVDANRPTSRKPPWRSVPKKLLTEYSPAAMFSALKAMLYP